MMKKETPLQQAEAALLSFWRSYVPGYDPRKRQYHPDVHSIANRTMLYYFMTEDLIEYFRRTDVPQYSATALHLMHVSPSTLKSWRDKWGPIWRKMTP